MSRHVVIADRSDSEIKPLYAFGPFVSEDEAVEFAAELEASPNWDPASIEIPTLNDPRTAFVFELGDNVHNLKGPRK